MLNFAELYVLWNDMTCHDSHDSKNLWTGEIEWSFAYLSRMIPNFVLENPWHLLDCLTWHFEFLLTKEIRLVPFPSLFCSAHLVRWKKTKQTDEICSLPLFCQENCKVLGKKGQIRSNPTMCVANYPGEFGIFLSTTSRILIVLQPNL